MNLCIYIVRLAPLKCFVCYGNYWIKAINSQNLWHKNPWELFFTFCWSRYTIFKIITILLNDFFGWNSKYCMMSLIIWIPLHERSTGQRELRCRLTTTVVRRHFLNCNCRQPTKPRGYSCNKINSLILKLLWSYPGVWIAARKQRWIPPTLDDVAFINRNTEEQKRK